MRPCSMFEAHKDHLIALQFSSWKDFFFFNRKESNGFVSNLIKGLSNRKKFCFVKDRETRHQLENKTNFFFQMKKQSLNWRFFLCWKWKLAFGKLDAIKEQQQKKSNSQTTTTCEQFGWYRQKGKSLFFHLHVSFHVPHL